MQRSIFELLQLRSEWEDLVRNFTGVNQNGTLDSLQEFLDNGHKKNRFRDGYDLAIDIAQEILKGA
jgi:hypothetical protein